MSSPTGKEQAAAKSEHPSVHVGMDASPAGRVMRVSLPSGLSLEAVERSWSADCDTYDQLAQDMTEKAAKNTSDDQER
ncbi:hypothetical protein P7K49_025023 [Saguinus oedipus]|uniref:Uncharacterized protein n=1 Tax=Saguinus oedipus TaxID=9490 RepID=A0ABQ9UFW8_SAGOE|nr:hypothetical protein P7K49_025023 [Saguinus oedipus]